MDFLRTYLPKTKIWKFKQTAIEAEINVAFWFIVFASLDLLLSTAYYSIKCYFRRREYQARFHRLKQSHKFSKFEEEKSKEVVDNIEQNSDIQVMPKAINASFSVEDSNLDEPDERPKRSLTEVLTIILLLLLDCTTGLFTTFSIDVLIMFDLNDNIGTFVLKFMLICMLAFIIYLRTIANMDVAIGKGLCKFVKYSPLTLLLIILYMVWFNYISRGVCSCQHNDLIHGATIQDMQFSTAYSRSMYDVTCPNEDKPCHVYATLPEDALGGVFINFHVNIDSCKNSNKCKPVLYLAEFDTTVHHFGPGWKKVKPVLSEYKTPPYEANVRNVFTAYLTGLKKAQTYMFKISEPGWSSEPQIYTYNNWNELYNSNMTILSGGDIGNTKRSKIMTENTVSKINPDLIMIGGDVAYDNNVATCYIAWDHIFEMIPHQRYDEQSGYIRVIPMILSVGNHDLGIPKTYSDIKTVYSDSSPIIKYWFPQSTTNGSVSKISDEKSYSYHKIGDELMIFALDSGYESPVEGEQTEWMESVLSQHTTKNMTKFAFFHAPIYPAIYGSRDQKVQENGKQYWVPLFDEYEFKAIFENHNHVNKRTKPLKNNKINENGTVYLGEGSWGEVRKDREVTNEDIMEVLHRETAVWVVKLNKTGHVEYEARNSNNTIIDQF